MFVGEYDYDTDIKVHEEVAREQKAVEAARNALTMNLTAEQAAQITGLPLDQVLELQKELAATTAQPSPAN
ncbi:MAG: hypothetical protein J6V90_10190 [Treponema sp.]|nr:hypothetical protein [Treponema sp.]